MTKTKMNRCLADIRIKDEKGREATWLLRKDEERIFRNEFIPFPTGIQIGKHQTDVIIKTNGKQVSSFVMRLKNADSDKKATLLGSHDQKTWYTVKEHLRLNGISNLYLKKYGVWAVIVLIISTCQLVNLSTETLLTVKLSSVRNLIYLLISVNLAEDLFFSLFFFIFVPQ